MGYLNTQLEKVAYAATVGMEKQALSIADILRMGKDAVTRGKALHFAKRLEQRNKAIANQFANRQQQASEAVTKLAPALELERGYGVMGPNRKEYYRLLDRVPIQSNTVVDKVLSPNLDTSLLGRLSSWMHTPKIAPITANQVADAVRILRSAGERWI